MRKSHVSFSPKMSRSKDDRTFVIDFSHSNNSHVMFSYVMHSRPQTNFFLDLSVYMLFCVHIVKHLETAPVPGSVDQIITELWN